MTRPRTQNRIIASALWCLALAGALLCGCATNRLVPITPFHSKFRIAAPRDQVFEASLAVAQQLNLTIAVLDKSSGLVRFERTDLSADLLDRYCKYPYVNSSTGQPANTFANVSRDSLAIGQGAVRGSVSLTLLLSIEAGDETQVSLRANWLAETYREHQPCTSRGNFEAEFATQLRAQALP